MRQTLLRIDEGMNLALVALMLMSALMWCYLRVVFRAIPKRRVAVLLSWAASIATVYLLGWSSPIRQQGMLRAFPLMSVVPLTYFWVRWSRTTR